VSRGRSTKIADVNFPTRWAHFRLIAFEAVRGGSQDGGEHRETALALVLGELSNLRNDAPIVRIHSQCTTGEVFHSLRCDCHDQLHMAMQAIAQEGAGILLYEQQEGRGIGLMEKMRAYELQDQGLDTIEANLRLGHPVDARDYALAVNVLVMLGIRSVRLMTNNPEKIRAVGRAGIEIVERMSATVPFERHSARYMATKREKLGHLMSCAELAAATSSGAVPAALSVAQRSDVGLTIAGQTHLPSEATLLHRTET
jgi:GTP cyclohydrolase II